MQSNWVDYSVFKHQRTTDTQMIPKQDLLFQICDSLLLLYTMVKSRDPWTFKPRMALTKIQKHLRVACTGWLGVLELKYTLEKEETKILFSLQQSHAFKPLEGLCFFTLDVYYVTRKALIFYYGRT